MTTIYFDMDGTIANLYGVENWFEELRASNPMPYIKAKPMWDMKKLSCLLQEAQKQGYQIGIITWLSKETTKEYTKATTKAKKAWLTKYLTVEINEAHYVRYGTRKDYVAKDKQGILFDDNDTVRAQWRGQSYNPTNQNILEILENLLQAE